MKTILTTILFPLFMALPIQAQEKPAATPEKVTIKLTSGETMTGKVGGIKDESVSLMTDYGVVRIPVDKISEESRQKLNIQPESDVSKLKSRVTELEALVATLREENANLRKKGASGTPATPGTQATPKPEAAKTSTGDAAFTFKLSSSGKRHNSRCRYFKSAGDTCGPNDGEPCKVCGG